MIQQTRHSTVERDLDRSELRTPTVGRDLERSELREPAFGRDLDRSELRELVAEIAAEPGRWERLVRFDTSERHFEELWRDSHVDVWVISWVNGNDTGFHDHDLSRGAVAVVQGEVVEERFMLDGPPRPLSHRAGEVFDFDASHVHRMRQESAEHAVTIHAYSPPLWRLGTYTTSADGELRRQSISYMEELRPAAVAAP